MTRYGVSYWGRDPRRARNDAARIAAAGFSWVNVPISEERMAFDFDGTARVITALQMERIEVRASPWGVAGLFGGEGIASRSDPLETARRWLDRAERLDPDAIYWDEPRGVHGASAITLAHTHLPEHVYLNPRVGIAPDAETLARMTSIGIDCYDGDTRRVADDAARLEAQHGKPIHVWLRAFRVAREAEGRIPDLISWLTTMADIEEIAVWGYPSPGVSCLDNDRPRKVWNAVLEGIGAHPATRATEATT